MVLIASCESFVVQDVSSRLRYTTELYKYRPTKWSPQSGSATFTSSSSWGSGTMSVVPTPAPAPATAFGFTMDDLAKQWAAMNSEAGSAPVRSTYSVAATPVSPQPPAPAASFRGATSSSSGPKNYSVTRWNPRTGSQPMGGGSSSSSGTMATSWSPPPAAAPAAAPVSYAPPPAAAPQAYSAPRGDVRKNYSVTRWNPRTGAQPMSIGSRTVGAWSPPAAAATQSFVAPPPPTPAPTGPSMSDLAKSWAAMNTDHDSTPSRSFASPPPPKAAPVASTPSSSFASSSGSGPKNMYSVSKWNPRAGSSQGGQPGGWTPPAAAAASHNNVAAAAAPPKAAADPMAALAAQWAAMNRS